MAGSTLVILGLLLAALTVRADSWIGPVVVCGAIIAAGLVRSAVWVSHARRLKFNLGAGWVEIYRGDKVVLKAAASQMTRIQWITPAFSVMISPNSMISTLVLHVDNKPDPVEVELWMPFQTQVNQLRQVWEDHGLPRGES